MNKQREAGKMKYFVYTYSDKPIYRLGRVIRGFCLCFLLYWGWFGLLEILNTDDFLNYIMGKVKSMVIVIIMVIEVN